MIRYGVSDKGPLGSDVISRIYRVTGYKGSRSIYGSISIVRNIIDI